MISVNCNDTQQGNGMNRMDAIDLIEQPSPMDGELLFAAEYAVQGSPKSEYRMVPNGRRVGVRHVPIQINQGNFSMALEPLCSTHGPTESSYKQQKYFTSPTNSPVSNVSDISGFIKGIKRFVNNIVPPMNYNLHLDYSVHHRQRRTPNNQPSSSSGATNDRLVPIACREIITLFTSEDFPELPVPRRLKAPSTSTEAVNRQPESSSELTIKRSSEAVASSHSFIRNTIELGKSSVSFEIIYSNKISGRPPTIGGRIKFGLPPFSFHKSKYAEIPEQDAAHPEEDYEDDGFVLCPNNLSNQGWPFDVENLVSRQRQISECSDDSFVVFLSEDSDVEKNSASIGNDFEDDDEDDDDLNVSDYNTSDDDEEDDVIEYENIDTVDSSSFGNYKTDRLKKFSAMPTLPQNADFDSGFDERKVNFNPHPVVYVMRTWSFAYRAARKGHWEDFARDRSRFHKRIERASIFLNPILDSKYRDSIYKNRFLYD